MPLTKEQIARRIAQEVKSGMYINLGIGIPTLVANYIPSHVSTVLQSENGLLGIGPFPVPDQVDADLINAGKQTITMQLGAALFSSAESFAMIRGQHVDLTVLGAMEVSQRGDIANWKIPGKRVKGMGGAMDLVAAARQIIVAMQHSNRAGDSKLLQNCSLPLTGLACVDMIVTDLGVFAVDKQEECFILLERAEDVSIDEIKQRTAGRLIVRADQVRSLSLTESSS